jgi:hypothetical protein
MALCIKSIASTDSDSHAHKRRSRGVKLVGLRDALNCILLAAWKYFLQQIANFIGIISLE